MNNKFLFYIILILLHQNHVRGQTETYKVTLAPFSTSNYDEFSPVYYRNGIVFSSNRGSSVVVNYSTASNKGLFKIYYVDTTKNSSSRNARTFSKEIESSFNDGPASFSSQYDEIYYSRNIESEKKLKDISSSRNTLGIFSAEFVKGKWTDIQEFRFNNEYYNVTTPCLSPDSKRLYFASDKTGGFGGSDLYYCQKKNGYWDSPVNLGPTINTSGNEAFPFITPEGNLFFSSNGHPGLGGKDIFYSEMKDDLWKTPIPLDPPINSKDDDFSLCTNSNLDEGYFASNRGKSIDIYHFKRNFTQMFYCDIQVDNQRCYLFTDTSTLNNRITNLALAWNFGNDEKVLGSTVTHCFPKPGKYKISQELINIKTGITYFIKSMYDLEIWEIEQAYITSADLAVLNESVDFNGLNSNLPGKEILKYEWSFGDGSKDLGGIVSHTFKEKGDYLVRLGLTLKDINTGIVSESCISKKIIICADAAEIITRSEQLNNSHESVQDVTKDKYASLINRYSIQSELQQDAVYQLEILSSKKRISLNSQNFRKIPDKYFLKEVYQQVDSTYSYVVDEGTDLSALYPSYLEMLALGFTSTRTRTYILKNPAEKELNNLKKVYGIFSDAFFEENKYTASSGAYPILNQVIEIMNKYPRIKIEIAAHADDPGTIAYNQELSQKRAQTMANYLIKNGIRADRLIVKGFGKSKPMAMGSTMEDKMINRRVEFIIINE